MTEMLAEAVGNPFDSETSYIVFVAGTVALMFLAMTTMMATRYKKAGPNQALVISGMPRTAGAGSPGKGFRIVTGGGTFVWPVIERAQVLSLEVMSIEVCVDQPTAMQAVAMVKVANDMPSLTRAAECFLSKPQSEIARLASQPIENRLHEAARSCAGKEISAQSVQEVAAKDLAAMGLELLSFALRDGQPRRDVSA